MAHLDEYKLLSDRQHAFRKGHSCGTQLTTVTNDWAKILDNRGQVDTFILDFEKAFDRENKDEKDTMKLQRDIDRLGSWARKWGMRFQPVKCNMMQLTRKRIKKIYASYTLEGTNLEKVESIKYLGVTITSDLRWNTHVSNVCTKANRTLGFLRRNLHSCPQEVKEAAYKGLVRPVLDYGSSVWDPPGVVLQEELESVQKRAARFVTGNCNYETGSMTGILGQLTLLMRFAT